MKSKLTVLSLLIMFFSLNYEVLPFTIPLVSSPGPASSSLVSVLGTTAPINVEAVQNFVNSINITGNMVISGSNVTRFVGISPSLPARVYLNGSIFIQGNGTLILQYVTLYFVAWKNKTRASPDYSRNIIVADPVTVGLGQSSAFISQVSGGVPPYQYQWYFNNSIVLGANSSTWVFTPTSVGTYQVYVKVVDALGMTVQSEFQFVTVTPLPSVNVAVNPASAVVYLGNSVIFNSSVTGGTAPYFYQWYLNGNPASGATQSEWIFTPTSKGNYQVYLVVKDSSNAQGTSSIVPVSVSLPPPPPQPLSVTINPVSSNASLGQSSAFISQVSGGVPPYQYQWYLNGNPVSGATNPTWAFTPTSTGTYEIYVEITDAGNVVVQSTLARVTVTPPTPIKVIISPSLAITDVGKSVVFNSSVTGGTGYISYQWYSNGKQVSTTPKSWVFTPTLKDNYQVYLVVKDVRNAQGTSNIVPVSVYPISVTTAPSYGTGRPRLVVSNATIVSSTYTPQSYGGKSVDVSLGCAIYARGNSEITGKELKFYRTNVHPDSARVGKPCVLNCSGESVVDLSLCTVDLVATYDNARVSIYKGNGPRIVTLKSAHDKGIGFQVCNSSRVDIFGVDFNNATVSGNANMSLVHCVEMDSCSLWTKDFAKVDISDGTSLVPSPGNRAGLNVAGNSYATFNSSDLRGVRDYTVLAVKENGTLYMVGNCSVLGPIVFSDHSKVFFSGMRRPEAFRDMWIDAYDFSYVSFYNCELWGVGLTYTYSIEFYNSSHLSFVNSEIWFGQIKLFDVASVYMSNSTLKACRVLANDLANVTFADGCDIENTLEMRDGSRLVVESSYVRIVFGVDSGRISLVNAKASALDLKDVSKLLAENSTIESLILTTSNAIGSWAGFTNFFENMSLTLASHSPNITLFNTYVLSLDLMFLGNSRVTISNSTIGNLGLQDSSVVTLYNVSAIWDSISVSNNAKLYVSSLLRVRTVDYFGNPLPRANVTAQRTVGSKTTVLKRLTADKDGWVSFVLSSEFINASGRFPVLDVTVESEFNKVSDSKRVDLALVNKDVTVSLPLPSWSRYILPVVLFVVVVVVLAVLSFVYKKFRKRR
jgi:hypothetical protein